VAYGTSYDGQEFKVFELEDPRPLAHLVYDYRDASGNAEFARQIMADARVDLREMAVTLAPLPLELPVERPALSRIDDFRTISPQALEMTVSTGANALLTVAIPNYPGWRAYVDGAQVEVVDTYAGLMGIPLRAGENQTVRLEFAPTSVRLGGALSAATLAAAAILCVGAGLWRRGAQRVGGNG
jgi:hypothetical protein